MDFAYEVIPLPREAAKRNKNRPDHEATREPMRSMNPAERRRLSTDEKKVRRRRSKTATKPTVYVFDDRIEIPDTGEILQPADDAIPIDAVLDWIDWDEGGYGEIVDRRHASKTAGVQYCYCENLHCGVGHEPGHCSNGASDTVKSLYIGNICDPCAAYMPDEFIFPIDAPDRPLLGSKTAGGGMCPKCFSREIDTGPGLAECLECGHQFEDKDRGASKTAAAGDRVQLRMWDYSKDDWDYFGDVGTVVDESPNGFGLTVEWDNGTRSEVSVLEVGDAPGHSATRGAMKTAVWNQTTETSQYVQDTRMGFPDEIIASGVEDTVEDAKSAAEDAMSTTASKRSAMNTTRQRETEILDAMSRTSSLDEQRKLAVELDQVRRVRNTQHQASTGLDMSDTTDIYGIEAITTPVVPHTLHTAATDWMSELADDMASDADSMTHAMRTEARMWFSSAAPVARIDRGEFSTQAVHTARRLGSQYGDFAPNATREFLAETSRLAGFKVGFGEDDPDTSRDDAELRGGPQPESLDTPWGEQMDDSGIGVSSVPTPETNPEAFDTFAPVEQAASPPLPEDVDYNTGGYLSSRRVTANTCEDCGHECNGPAQDCDCDNPHCSCGEGYGNENDDDEGNGDSKESRRVTSAYDAGYIAGRAAGTWVVDSHTSSAQVERILQGIASGDPGVMGMQPSPPSDEIAKHAEADADNYTAGYSEGFWDEVEASARYLASTRRFASEPIADDSGHAVTDLQTAQERFDEDWQAPAYPWEMEGTGTGAADVANVPTPGEGGYPQPTASRRKTAEGQTCSVCGDSIAKSDDGSYHHNNGESHDHEAKPNGNGDSKESARRRQAAFRQRVQSNMRESTERRTRRTRRVSANRKQAAFDVVEVTEPNTDYDSPGLYVQRDGEFVAEVSSIDEAESLIGMPLLEDPAVDYFGNRRWQPRTAARRKQAASPSASEIARMLNEDYFGTMDDYAGAIGDVPSFDTYNDPLINEVDERTIRHADGTTIKLQPAFDGGTEWIVAG